ncbi:light-harvesting complex-like protein OHP1, chloroplastic [Magnolia sinica]|uniref:light-harvesting complex-like protein OHP1, chloroplastic n=1 Tax=Magnolia sinica TaxID=86752 RepID=UPI002658D242|nr:light-harvesting complex-like protein OHP1, chloroplastic [Magnolia sinica]
MATLPTISASLLPNRSLTAIPPTQYQPHCKNFNRNGNFQKSNSFKIRAAKLPPGVEMPKVEPKLAAPFFGFTRTAEIWNSRACMIGLIGTFIVELIFHKGILQIIGIDVGKGLDIPL